MDYDILQKYLNTYVNPNIDWKSLMNKNMLFLDDIENENNKKYVEKFIRKVKLLGWIDKSDPIEDTRRDYYIEHYTRLIHSIDIHDKHVMILVPKTHDIYDDEERVDVLCNLLTFKGIQYTVTDDVNKCDECDILFIVPQFDRSVEEYNKIDKSKLTNPTDEYYDIVRAKSENDIKRQKYTYDFIHTIERYMKTDEITNKHYNYVVIEST